MLECIKFLLQQVINLITMLFHIDLGFTNMGTLLCVIYIFLPIVLFIASYFKHMVIEEVDERYDEGRPREMHYASRTRSARADDGSVWTYSHSFEKSRRRKIR